ncbi:hypothetical protein AMS68_003056 [Peltaster fructicola]|uniref:Uncharacterized protein n=1 Tax=Peltaster fructicola TaxID=286661 RepID=A0A6H0XSE2_9PEZI|nr:hypothetical protein AMS68_003056 [Peltaster fructicola]
MASIYTDFLKSPNAATLSSKAILSYITTTTVLSDPTAIIKHLQAQAKQLSRDDKVLNVIESSNGVAIETETTLKFRAGGGAFLPGVDDNLLDEKTAVVPVVHIVTFDAQQKISAIRQYWEQGTLLKQVEAIGRNGRNWPIRDGKALVDTVKSSVKADGSTAASSGATGSEASRSVSVSATRDPHASLQLFSGRDANAERQTYDGPSVAPRASAKPAPRDYGELFTNGEESPSAKRSSSPSKIDGRTVKANSGKNFVANRLFDENTPVVESQSPEKKKKTYAQKYDHFAFGDGEEATQNRPTSKHSKSTSHFSFEDFSTPPKFVEKPRPDQVRNWGAGVDEDDPERSPERREIVHRPRPDAESHFEITDKSPAYPAKKNPPATTVDNTRRGQDFAAHYEIADESPAGAPKQKHNLAPRAELQPHWGFGTPSPDKKIYKTAGDGMGGRSGARTWGIGQEWAPENESEIRASARSRRAQPQADAGAEN